MIWDVLLGHKEKPASVTPAETSTVTSISPSIEAPAPPIVPVVPVLESVVSTETPAPQA